MKEQLTHINEKVNEMLKKIGMMVFAIILLANISFCADTYKTIYNPFTYTMDYVMDSFGNLTIENLTVDNIFAGNSTFTMNTSYLTVNQMFSENTTEGYSYFDGLKGVLIGGAD